MTFVSYKPKFLENVLGRSFQSSSHSVCSFVYTTTWLSIVVSRSSQRMFDTIKLSINASMFERSWETHLSFQNNLLVFFPKHQSSVFYLENNVQCHFSGRTSLKCQFYGPTYSKSVNYLMFLEKQFCLLEKPIALFHSSRYQSTMQLLAKSCGQFDDCAWFLATQIWLESVSTWMYGRIIFLFKFDFFRTTT